MTHTENGTVYPTNTALTETHDRPGDFRREGVEVEVVVDEVFIVKSSGFKRKLAEEQHSNMYIEICMRCRLDSAP